MGNGVPVEEAYNVVGVQAVQILEEVKPPETCPMIIDIADDMLHDISLPTQAVEAAQISLFQQSLIRMLDIVGTVVGLVILSPLFFIISFLIKVTSRGPIIYRQLRVGENGNIFVLYKFRTMIKHAEKVWGFKPASEKDERVTHFGKLLRKTRLDELPQLINVLKGDMSLVGPRPENLYRVRTHKALRGTRLAVKPGITGLAQIRSLYDLKPDHKIKYDYLYIQKRSFLLNLYILLKTIPVLFSKTGW